MPLNEGGQGRGKLKKTLRLEPVEMILRATDPCKIHVLLGFLDARQISNWRWLSSYYVPNCTHLLYWFTPTTNYMEHLSIWKSMETVALIYQPHTAKKSCQLGGATCWSWGQPALVAHVHLGAELWGWSTGGGFTVMSQNKGPGLFLGFLKCVHQYAC